MRHSIQLGALLLLLVLLLSLAAPTVTALAADTTEATVIASEEPAAPAPAEEQPTAPAASAFPLPVPVATDDMPRVDVKSDEFMLANSYNSVGFEYALPEYGSFYGLGLDPRIIEITSKMVDDAHADGIRMYVSVAYRNMDFLLNNYMGLCATYGAVEACKRLLPPGCNEHQTGFAIDVTNNQGYQAAYFDFQDEEAFTSEVFDWMMAHCTDYGYILRYPVGKEAWYGVPCPHLHFRYVGVEAAKYIMSHDLCLEEFLYLQDPHCLFVPNLTSYT